MPAKAEDILSGFRVNWMNLRDADTGKILWQVTVVTIPQLTIVLEPACGYYNYMASSCHHSL